MFSFHPPTSGGVALDGRARMLADTGTDATLGTETNS